MGHFIEELKRRKVIKVAIAYIVSAWVLLQVAELLSSILELPTWTAKLVLVLLLLGFIPALILAWAYDLTPDGIRADSEVTGDSGTASGSGKSVVALATIGILFVGAAGAAYCGR